MSTGKTTALASQKRHSLASRQLETIRPRLRQLDPRHRHQTNRAAMTSYLTLLSDASLDLYLYSTISRFQFRLQRRV